MAETPSVTPSAPVAATPSPAGTGIRGFLERDTAGIPNWAWLIILPAGILAAIFIPRLFGSSSSSAASGTDTSGDLIDPSTGLPYGNAYAAYIDPTTGIPYSLEATTPTTTPASTTTTTPTSSGTDTDTGSSSSSPVAGAKYYTVNPWPQPGSTLSSIAAIVGVPLASVEALNPQISNVNLIYPGQQVRYH
jgi:LysM repeat protein